MYSHVIAGSSRLIRETWLAFAPDDQCVAGQHFLARLTETYSLCIFREITTFGSIVLTDPTLGVIQLEVKDFSQIGHQGPRQR